MPVPAVRVVDDVQWLVVAMQRHLQRRNGKLRQLIMLKT